MGDSFGATLRISETTSEALTNTAVTAGVGTVASTAVKGVVVATKTASVANKLDDAADLVKTAGKTDGVASGGSGGGSVGSVSTTSTNAAVKAADEASGGSGSFGGAGTTTAKTQSPTPNQTPAVTPKTPATPASVTPKTETPTVTTQIAQTTTATKTATPTVTATTTPTPKTQSPKTPTPAVTPATPALTPTTPTPKTLVASDFEVALKSKAKTFDEALKRTDSADEFVTYRRVQGGNDGDKISKFRIEIQSDGTIKINNKNEALSVSVDNGEHSQYFLTKRKGAEIYEFDVPKWFDDMLQKYTISQKITEAIL